MYRKAPPKQDPTSKTDDRLFTSVESNRAIKFADIDQKWSYFDIDWGPEAVELDPIPDLVEVDIGPSAVSQELVRSPIEIKISSFLKALFAPRSPTSSGSTDKSAQSATTTDRKTHHWNDNTSVERSPAIHNSRESRYRGQDKRKSQFDEFRKPVERDTWRERSRPQSPSQDCVKNHRRPADPGGYSSWKEPNAIDTRRPNNSLLSPSWPGIDETSLTPNLDAVDEPAADHVREEQRECRTPFDVGQAYSPLQGHDSNPVGPEDMGPVFPEPPESPLDPIGSGGNSVELFPEFSNMDCVSGVEPFDWTPDGTIKEPMVDPGVAEEMFGLDRFAEPQDGPVELPGPDVDNDLNPLFPETDAFSIDDSVENDWLSF